MISDKMSVISDIKLYEGLAKIMHIHINGIDAHKQYTHKGEGNFLWISLKADLPVYTL